MTGRFNATSAPLQPCFLRSGAGPNHSRNHEGTSMRHRFIPAALAAGASLTLLAGTAMAATPTWTVVPSVNPSVTTLNAVSARTATDAWAVGQFPGVGDDAGSKIFAERWNGTQWQQTPTTNIVRVNERLLGVSASGPNDAWAVGNMNALNAA